MKSKLEKQLKMKKSFVNLETEVFLNLLRTATLLVSEGEKLLKSQGISGVQYNVLRILRDNDSAGLPSLEIAERMITPVPDITRLVDRLLKQDFVSRERCSKDRRIVYVKIAQKGKRLLRRLDKPVVEQSINRFKHMSKKNLRFLNELLVEARKGR